MKLLALSGSLRRTSTNTAMLTVMRDLAPMGLTIEVFDNLGSLPIFSPDNEGTETPPEVVSFKQAITAADGLIIASPEYVRTLPGGLKNAIDWLVSGEEIIDKPIFLAHASHRGDDMLATLRTVLHTVSSRFHDTPFIRLPLMKMTVQEVNSLLHTPENMFEINKFLTKVRTQITTPV